MKWLILSDNHGRWQATYDWVQFYRPQVDLIFHCGDSEFQADDPLWEMVDAVVTGNNDFDPAYARELVISTKAGKVFMTHGHFHNVYFTTDKMLAAAKANDCQFAFHGHTHVAYAKYEQGVLLCNPGSFNHSRGPLRERTYAMLTVEDQKLTVEFYNERKECLTELTQVFEKE